MTDNPEKQKCARCHRWFQPREPEQRYGPKCAVKVKNNHIEVKNTKGEIVAVIV